MPNNNFDFGKEQEEIFEFLKEFKQLGEFDENAGAESAISQLPESDNGNNLFSEKMEGGYENFRYLIQKIPVYSKKEEWEAFKKYAKQKNFVWGVIKEFPVAKRLRVEFTENNPDMLECQLKAEVIYEVILIIERLFKAAQGAQKIKSNGNLAGRQNFKEIYREIKKETGLRPKYLTNSICRVFKEYGNLVSIRNEIVQRNIRLVMMIAIRIPSNTLSYKDRIQGGNIGLMKAVDKFEYRKGYKFSTYSLYWIRQAIQRANLDNLREIRLPVHVCELLNKISSAFNKLSHELRRAPANIEIAEELKVPLQKIEETLESAKNIYSLHYIVGDDTEAGNLIQDKNSPCPYSETESKNVTEKVLEVLSTLSPKEAEVIKKRFGIDMDRDYTLEEIGKSLVGRYGPLTREGVRQIEKKALAKLNHPKRRRQLEKLLN